MAVLRDDMQRWWRHFGWRWLDERASNGAVRVLTALQAPEADSQGSGGVDSDPDRPSELSDGAHLLLLWLELVGIGGAVFLLLQMSFVAGLLASKASVRAVGSNWMSGIVAKIVETAATAYGLVSIFGWMFGRSRSLVLRKLLGLKRVEIKLFLLYVAANAAALAMVARGINDDNRSEENIHYDLVRSLTTLVAAPLTEELLFRGLVLHVVLNRTRSEKAAAITPSVLFALLHLANVRKIGIAHFSASYVALQTLWALLVGGFLSTRMLVSGSLAECLILHSANNFFAIQAARSLDKNSASHCVIVIASFVAYAAAIGVSLHQLRRHREKLH